MMRFSSCVCARGTGVVASTAATASELVGKTKADNESAYPMISPRSNVFPTTSALGKWGENAPLSELSIAKLMPSIAAMN